MSNEEQWVGIDHVSSHLKVNKETIRRWIKSKDFPAHKAGNLLRFKLSEIDRWVTADSDTRQRGGN